MSRVRITIALVAVACAALGAALAFGPSSATGAARDREVWKGQPVDSIRDAKQVAHAGAPDTLTITAMQTAMVPVDVGDPGDSPGDYFVLNLRIFDENAEAAIGRGAVQCVFGINTQSCDATIRIYGRGQIMVDATLYPSGTVQSFAIVGGTGEFRGAGGVARMMQTPEIQILVFHFTR